MRSIKVLIVSVVATAALFGCDSKDGTSQPPAERASTPAAANEKPNNEANAAPVAAQAPQRPSVMEELVSAGQAFEPGSYAKGTIPKGEYAYVGRSEGYFGEEINGHIIDNQIFPSFGYVFVHGIGDIKTDGYLLSPVALNKLGYKSASEVFRSLTKQDAYNFSGMYKVGADLPAGNYVIESAGAAYVFVNTGPAGNGEIVWNDNFHGTKSANLTNGQYLELNNASISPVRATGSNGAQAPAQAAQTAVESAPPGIETAPPQQASQQFARSQAIADVMQIGDFDINLRSCPGTTCSALVVIPKHGQVSVDATSIRNVTEASGAQTPWARITYSGPYCEPATLDQQRGCVTLHEPGDPVVGWVNFQRLSAAPTSQ
ncbi:hypothetical protein [Paraburkholderia tuberum]|uniref:hypothetical protein n=1 Tax=Paraburkholderia TaxID=1822464 RepID=UPI0013A69EE8|nr:hypothetical protein [Paraburkholderia tuberum]